MTDKIIFWLDSALLSYCLSYYLQKMHDSELYAIIDITNKTKSFFQKQDLVEFKKKWFYFDNVFPKNNLDKDYLEKFEKKYEINLWQLAINERFFYKYNSYYKFSDEEILSILEQECKLFENIITEPKPDFFITKETIQHKDYLFSELCKKNGITVLTLHESLLGYRSAISQESHTFDFVDNLQNTEYLHEDFKSIQEFLKSFNKSKQVNDYKDDYISSRLKRIQAARSFLFSKTDNEHTHFTYYGRTTHKVLFNELKTSLAKKRRKNFIDKNFLYDFNKEHPFIYFPLSIDQERSLLLAAPYFTNQTEIIRHIVKSLPVGYKIFVKEHPHQVFRNWRTIEEYKEIMGIPNVHLIHPSVNPKKLYDSASLVISVGGTSGFDAAVHGKPTIIFSDYGYKILSSVYRVEKIEDLPKIIINALKKSVDPRDVSKYVNLLVSNSFDFDLYQYYIDEFNHFFFGGNLADVEIPIEKMKIFLEKNKLVLEKLSNEHIKKIQQFKQSNKS